MHCLFQFLLGITLKLKFKREIGAYAKSVSVAVCYLNGTDVCPVAVFLRSHISVFKLLDRPLMCADTLTCLSVAVRLVRSSAVPLNVTVLLAYSEPYSCTKHGQNRACHILTDIYTSVAVDDYIRFNITCKRCKPMNIHYAGA